MLADSMIRLGRAIKASNWSIRDRIHLLTDSHSINCKNYFQNVFVAEISPTNIKMNRLTVGEHTVDKKDFRVDQDWSTSFPIIYPNGGNPLHAQGVYPLPCYLLYDPHIKSFQDKTRFIQEFLLPRIKSTIDYQSQSIEEQENLAEMVSEAISSHASEWVKDDKQLGILMIVDGRLPYFVHSDETTSSEELLYVTESRMTSGKHLYLHGEKALGMIAKAKFMEAGSLGRRKNAVSTFTNQNSDEVVSIYNKSWLWLSPTWDMPKPLSWNDNDWTNGIKVDMDSYESFLYGTQFLKEITRPLRSSILKEMFAPIQNSEAKQHIKPTSMEPIFGAPIILPILDGSAPSYESYMLKRLLSSENSTDNGSDKQALQLEIVAGVDRIISTQAENMDEYRLSLLYYSGDLSRGNMHIRAMIEDVVPSVARKIEKIIEGLSNKVVTDVQMYFSLKEMPDYRISSLPALLGNAYGAGYIWDSLHKALHREDLSRNRVDQSTAIKLNELANKRNYWGMKHELVYYFCFLHFISEYRIKVQMKEKGVRTLQEWKDMMECYHQGTLGERSLESTEMLGYATGLLIRQFSDSYYSKTGKQFVEQRIMKFGSKLTPAMIWHKGVEICNPLKVQWKLNLAENFYDNISKVLIGLVESDKKGKLKTESHQFISAFWAGYLAYKNPKKQDNSKEGKAHANT